MKKFRFKSAMLRTALLTCAFASSVMGAKAENGNDFFVNGVKYSINAGTQTVTIAEQIPDSVHSVIVIPPVVTKDGNDYTVTAIEAGAYKSCNNLTSITLPYTLNEFKTTQINPHDYDSSLPNMSYTGSGAFADCANLVTANLGACTFTETKGAVFAKCISLTNVSMPNSLVTLSGYDFMGCKNLRTINLENTALETIGTYSFLQKNAQEGLQYVYLPESVTTIGKSAFYKNDLRRITDLGNRNYPTQEQADSCSYLTTSSNISLVSHLKNVTSIDEYAFSGNWSMSSIILPSLSEVPNYCFASCFNMYWIILGDNLTTIGDMSFNGLGNMTTLAYPSLGYTVSNNITLNGGTGLHFPATVTLLGKRAFYECTGFSDVYCLSQDAPYLYCYAGQTIFGVSVRESSYTFSLNRPGTLHYPANGTGYDIVGNPRNQNAQQCWKAFFTNLDPVQTNSSNAPRRNATRAADEDIFDLGDGSFIAFNQGLLFKFETIDGENVATLLNTDYLILGEVPADDPLKEASTHYTEKYGGDLTPLASMENSVWTTFTDSWNGWEFPSAHIVEKLEVSGDPITINGSIYKVKRIYAGAFKTGASYEMETINLPETMTEVEGKTTTETKLGLSEMPEPVVLEDATYLFFGNKAKKIVAPKELYSKMNAADFAHCENLETITTTDDPDATGINLPASVTTIAPYEFLNCKAITNITLPNSLQEIERSAFVGTNIETVTIPESVTEVGIWALASSTLKSVEINATSVENYDYAAFTADEEKKIETIFGTNCKKDDLAKFAGSTKAIAVRDVRNLTAGNFGTVCLGYDGKKPNVNDVEIYEVVGKTEENGELKSITIDVTSDDHLIAGKAYFFLAKTGRTFAFDRLANSDVILNAVTDDKTDIAANGLHGMLDADVVTGTDVYMLKENKLYKAATGSKCAANRAYLVVGEIQTPSVMNLSPKAKRFQFDDDATGILFVESDNQQPVSTAVYDLSGRRVTAPAAQKGIYIHNGKKYVK